MTNVLWKTSGTLVFMLSANTSFASANAKLKGVSEPDVRRGMIRRNLTHDVYCPLRVIEANDEFCAVMPGPDESVERVIETAGYQTLSILGDWKPAPGRTEVFEIAAVYLEGKQIYGN